MRRPLFFLVLLVSLYCKNNYAQFSFGASYELSAIQTQSEFLNYLQVYNENETWDLYRLNQNLGTLAQGIGVRSFGQRFSNNNRWQIGYSMELGYRFFRSSGNLIYQGSSTNNSDSILNYFNNLNYKVRYHVVRFTHYFDAHFNVSEKVKISNSIGVGLNAMVKINTRGVSFDGAMVSPNYPALTLNYQPQITEKYERFYLSVYLNLNLFRYALFTKPTSAYQQPDTRTWLSEVRMHSLGIRIIPIPKDKTKRERDF